MEPLNEQVLATETAAPQSTLTLPGREKRSLPRSPWFKFLSRRLVSLVFILLGLTFLVFMMVRLIPGDPARIILGPNANQAQVTQVRQTLGLDKPVLQQYVAYLNNLAHGDFGTSFMYHGPVTQLLGANVPASLQLAGAALALVLIVSIPGGMLAAALTKDGRNRGGEVAFTTVSSVAGSIPEFLTATFLVLVFAVGLKLLPVAGNNGVSSLVLPVIALSIRPIAVLIRIVRVETLNALHQDYIRTASSKQLPRRIIYLRHILPNVLTAALTIGGVLFTSLIAGAVVIENVFGRSGVGTLLVQSIQSRDYPVIQGIMLFLGVTVVIVNILVDLVLGTIDRRTLAGSVHES
jgi:peptide/nickel transport system permease protein